MGAVVLQWYTKVKYVTQYPFAYTLAVMAIDKARFGQLDAEDQRIVTEVFSSVYEKFERQNRADNDGAEEALRSNGLEFIDLDEGTLQGVRAKLAETSRQMARDGVFSLELLDQMLSHLDAFRSREVSAQVSANEPE